MKPWSSDKGHQFFIYQSDSPTSIPQEKKELTYTRLRGAERKSPHLYQSPFPTRLGDSSLNLQAVI
jgi:hypothetical protein